MTTPISAVINTRNEEHNLPYALRSIRSWVDEIVVVDMHSTDRTRDIAKEYGAEVYLHEPLGFADPARAFAIDQSHHDWVLVLDADELIPSPLSKTLIAATTRTDADIFSIPRENFMFGERLVHTGWGAAADRQLRFFRRGKLSFGSTVHQFMHPAPDARIEALPYEPGHAIVHLSYVNVEQFIEKLNRYTSIEAIQARERGEHVTPPKALMTAANEFWRRYVVSRGFRDGWRGLYLSLLMATYRLAVGAKWHELEENGAAERVVAKYVQVAERVLTEYER